MDGGREFHSLTQVNWRRNRSVVKCCKVVRSRPPSSGYDENKEGGDDNNEGFEFHIPCLS